MAPMIIPDIVLAIALLSFFNLLKVGLGLHSIIISHAVFNIAFVCAVVRTRLKHFDYSILEASIDLGASWFTTFRRVLLPAIFPGVLAGGLLVVHPVGGRIHHRLFQLRFRPGFHHVADADLRHDPLWRHPGNQCPGDAGDAGQHHRAAGFAASQQGSSHP